MLLQPRQHSPPQQFNECLCVPCCSPAAATALTALTALRWPWPGGDAPAAALAESVDAARAAAADVLAALMAQPSHGPRVSLLMGKLLPPGLVAAIAEGPPAAVLRALGQVRKSVEICVCWGGVDWLGARGCVEGVQQGHVWMCCCKKGISSGV
jgi:hypothetical protein